MLARYQRFKDFDWHNEFKNRHSFGLWVKSVVGGLSSQHYLHDEVSKEDFHEFVAMMNEHKQAGEFLIDELMCIVNDGDSEKNLTLRYYAEKVLQFMQQTLLSKKVQDFLQLPHESQLLETGASLLAQWCQPFENFTENDINDQLDNLAAEVLQDLKTTCPEHPALNADINMESVTSDLWSRDQCRMILDSINQVMFNKLNFECNKSGYYDVNNSYINKTMHNLQLMADENQTSMDLITYLMNATQTQMDRNKVKKDNKKVEVKRRQEPEDALYSVGLIMKHREYREYDCVIYGWDNKCEASQDWMIQIGVDRLPRKDKQPFYYLLVSDGTNRYVAEESLEMHSECCPITHPDVGRYFTSYEKTHYIPNTEKATEYPEDIEMTAKLAHEQYHS